MYNKTYTQAYVHIHAETHMQRPTQARAYTHICPHCGFIAFHLDGSLLLPHSWAY